MAREQINKDLLVDAAERSDLKFPRTQRLTVDSLGTKLPDIRGPTRHTGPQVSPGFTHDDCEPTCHIFQGMVSHTLDHCGGTRVSNKESLPHNTGDE